MSCEPGSQSSVPAAAEQGLDSPYRVAGLFARSLELETERVRSSSGGRENNSDGSRKLRLLLGAGLRWSYGSNSSRVIAYSLSG